MSSAGDEARRNSSTSAAGVCARADAIVWNGTSAAWTGFDDDRSLCALISEHTGIPSSSSTLAQLEICRRSEFSRVGLAVPYTDEVTERIIDVYASEGIEVLTSARAGVSGNREMAHVSEERVCELLRAADHPDAECLIVICTGVAGAQLVEQMEAELGKPIFDSVAVVLWKALALAGVEPRLAGWGSLFAGAAPALTG